MMLAPAVLLVAVLTLLTRGATGASPSLCARTTLLSNGETRLSFLRGSGSSRRLFLSAWSASRALLSCSSTDDTGIVRRHAARCRGAPTSAQQQVSLVRMMADAVEQCDSVDSSFVDVRSEKRSVRSAGRGRRSGAETKTRSRRGVIVPGTLWCGSGNKAPSYSDLGVFSETDKCCREHDQCQDTILSFHSKFGVFNSNIFTMSHCDCDNRFRRCLKEAQDSISDVVGYTFFNLLKMHCFELSYRLQCTERNWFGMCKESKMSLYAEVHPPSLYVTDTENDTSLTTTASSSQVHNIQRPSIRSTHTSMTTSRSRNTPVTDTLPPRNSNPASPLQDTDITGKWCDIFKSLDECRNRILPLQRKYSLKNNESRTMYHCNCTDRLLQSLEGAPVSTEVQTSLLEHVSLTCFVLKECKTEQSCKAVARTTLSQDGSSGFISEQRPLQVNSRRVTNKPVSLHRLCRRTAQRKSRKNGRHHSKYTVRDKAE